MSKKELNTNTNKPITIKKLKDSWNREEVIKLLEESFNDCTIMKQNGNNQPLVIVNKSYKNWIEINL